METSRGIVFNYVRYKLGGDRLHSSIWLIVMIQHLLLSLVTLPATDFLRVFLVVPIPNLPEPQIVFPSLFQ